MSFKRILTVQDISCVGQCSLTVALPILSACGVETGILPSAVLSTHTGGSFSGYTFRDLTEDMPAVAEHWKREGILFDAFYTGYLGSARQIEYVKRICAELKRSEDALLIADPAMADFGRLYAGFDSAFVAEMAKLCAVADVILPNLTEACLLTGTPYPEQGYDKAFVEVLLEKLCALGAKAVVLTGIAFREGESGVMVYENGTLQHYTHRLIDRPCHGTGDVYASVFTGCVLRGKRYYDAARIAADFTLRCIENTVEDRSHWYGVHFEPLLPELMRMLEE